MYIRFSVSLEFSLMETQVVAIYHASSNEINIFKCALCDSWTRLFAHCHCDGIETTQNAGIVGCHNCHSAEVE